MIQIPMYPARPTWNDELALLVPKVDYQDAHFLKKGSAIVVSGLPSGGFLAYFEGNIYNASNIKSYDDKALVAYGRMVQNYPTSAKMTISLEEFDVCGVICQGRCKIETNIAFERWVL